MRGKEDNGRGSLCCIRAMNRLLDTDTDEELHTGHHDGDREISLGTATILGLFFALALLCACVFGFGYTLGRKSMQTASLAPDPGSAPSIASAGFSSPKPSAGSQAAALPSPQPTAASVTTAQPAAAVATTVATRTAVLPSDTILAGDRLPQPGAAAVQPAASFVVQIAAVSSQNVADILLASLEKKGYTVGVRNEPQDSLLHVQIGPFAKRSDAEAMRLRVVADGFNAIVK
jgi:DedD protein